MSSSGSAIAENEKWLDSIEGKTQQFTNALQTMWSHIIDSEAVKRFVGFGTNLIELLDTTHGKIIALVAAIKLAAKFKNVSIGGVAKGFMQSLQQLRIAQSALSTLPKADGTNGAFIASNINAYASAVSNLVPRIQAQALASKGLNDEQIRLAMSANGVDEANIKLALSQTKVTSAIQQRVAVSGQEAAAILASKNIALSDTARQWLLKQAKDGVTKASIENAMAERVLSKEEGAAMISALGLTGANFGLAESFKAIGAGIAFAFQINPIGFLISLASTILSVVGVFKLFGDTAEDATQKIDSAIASANEINSTRKSIEEYKDSIIELREKLADSTISEQEAYDARAQLIDIQNQLIDKFGLEAEGINLVTGAIEDQISAIDELQRKSAEDWLADNNEAYQNAIKEMNKTYSNNKFIVSSESGTITRTTDQYGQVTENREITSQTLGSVSDEIRDAYNKGLKKIIEDAGGEIKESLNGGDYGGANYYNKNFTASFENKTVEELDAVFRDMQSFLIQFQKDNGVDLNARITQLEQLRKDIVDEDYIDARELYNKGRQQEAVATYGVEYGAILDAQEKFYNSTNDGDRLAAIKEYEQAIATAEQAATDAGQEHMQDFFAEMHNKFSKEEFELKIKTDEDGLKTKLEGIIKAGGESGLAALDDNQIKDMISKGLTDPEYHAGIYTNTYGYTQAQVKGLVDLQAAADTAGISVEDLISVLVNLGLIAGRPTEKAAESVEALRAAKAKGAKASGETGPHYLLQQKNMLVLMIF